jgi:iron complex transport system ATP-binding protein
LEELRGRVGVVMPDKTLLFRGDEVAADVVLSGLRGAFGRTRQMRFSREDRRKAARAMRRVGVVRLAERPFGALSSGEQRRFLVARALVHDPEVLVLDEPTTALDLPGAMGLLATMRDLIRAGTAVVMVTHDAREIPPEIERVVLLKKGQVLADGPKKTVMTSALLGRCYGLEVRVRWSGGFCEVHGS